MPRKPLIGSATALAPFIAGQGFYSASQIIEILLRYMITKRETCLAYQAGGPLSGPAALDIGDPEQGRSRREGRRFFSPPVQRASLSAPARRSAHERR